MTSRCRHGGISQPIDARYRGNRYVKHRQRCVPFTSMTPRWAVCGCYGNYGSLAVHWSERYDVISGDIAIDLSTQKHQVHLIIQPIVYLCNSNIYKLHLRQSVAIEIRLETSCCLSPVFSSEKLSQFPVCRPSSSVYNFRIFHLACDGEQGCSVVDEWQDRCRIGAG